MSTEINPLLEKIKLPGRIFQLPSKGLLYHNQELSPGCSNGEMHIHPLSALDEISMKNPDMLFSGKATDSVFKSCVPEIEKPLELFGSDIDAIMIFLRIVSYGPIYNLDIMHTCKNAKHHNYQINVEEFLTKIKYFDPTMLEDLYTLVLDNGQVIKLQPLRYKHVIDILHKNENKKELTAEDMKNNLITNLLNLIVSIDNVTDKQFISEWIRKVQTGYISKIAQKVEKSSNAWGCDLSSSVICKDCGTIIEIDVPINPINFFTE